MKLAKHKFETLPNAPKTEEYGMNFGEKMTLIRKQKKLSQAELGKRSGINGDIVGKYECNEMKPSIETAKKTGRCLGSFFGLPGR